MSVVLDVTVRENTGTGGARAARRDGLVPGVIYGGDEACLLYTSPSPRDGLLSRMPSSA